MSDFLSKKSFSLDEEINRDFFIDCFLSVGSGNKRNLTALTTDFGVKYKTAQIYLKKNPNDEDGYKRFIIEFLMRYDKDANDELERKYGIVDEARTTIEQMSYICSIPYKVIKEYFYRKGWYNTFFDILQTTHPKVLFFQTYFIYKAMDGFYHRSDDNLKFEAEFDRVKFIKYTQRKKDNFTYNFPKTS